jgi:hypothetical protein
MYVCMYVRINVSIGLRLNEYINKQVKLSLYLTKYDTMKMYWGSVGIDVSGQLHARGKSLQYPLDRRIGGTQSRSREGGQEKKFPPLTGIETQSSIPKSTHYTD